MGKKDLKTFASNCLRTLFQLKWGLQLLRCLQGTHFFSQHVFVVVFCYVALGMKHLASLQPSAWLPPVETPSDRSLSERRSWRPPWCFTLISCQVSHSVGECHSDSGSFWVYTKQRGRLESTAVAASARAWPRSGATPRRGVRKLHLSLAAQLAADGTLFPRVH